MWKNRRKKLKISTRRPMEGGRWHRGQTGQHSWSFFVVQMTLFSNGKMCDVWCQKRDVVVRCQCSIEDLKQLCIVQCQQPSFQLIFVLGRFSRYKACFAQHSGTNIEYGVITQSHWWQSQHRFILRVRYSWWDGDVVIISCPTFQKNMGDTGDDIHQQVHSTNIFQRFARSSVCPSRISVPCRWSAMAMSTMSRNRAQWLSISIGMTFGLLPPNRESLYRCRSWLGVGWTHVLFFHPYCGIHPNSLHLLGDRQVASPDESGFQLARPCCTLLW